MSTPIQTAIHLSRLLGHACAPEADDFATIHELWVAQERAVLENASESLPCAGSWTPAFDQAAPDPVLRTNYWSQDEVAEAYQWAREHLGWYREQGDVLARASTAEKLRWRTTTGRARFELTRDKLVIGLYSPAYCGGEAPYLVFVETAEEYALHVTSDTFRLAAEKPERLSFLWSTLGPALNPSSRSAGVETVVEHAPEWAQAALRELAVIDAESDRIYYARDRATPPEGGEKFARGETLASDDSAVLAQLYERSRQVALTATKAA